MHVFRHPKFYEEYRKRAKRYQKELRERNKSDQVISKEPATAGNQRAPGPGQQTTEETVPANDKQQADNKQQASSFRTNLVN